MQPFRTILFAADFSENSKAAFRVACSLAVEEKTRLIVLHVVEPNWVPQEPVFFGQATVQFQNAGRDEAYHESLKRKLAEVYTPNHPIDMAFQTREGDPSAEIVRMANESGCDLIVMGTHGRTGLSWLLAGSVAIAVLRKARCPVLALRSPDAPRKAEEIRVILHPTDFSECSEGAVLEADGGDTVVVERPTVLERLEQARHLVGQQPGDEAGQVVGVGADVAEATGGT